LFEKLVTYLHAKHENDSQISYAVTGDLPSDHNAAKLFNNNYPIVANKKSACNMNFFLPRGLFVTQKISQICSPHFHGKIRDIL